MPIQARTPPLLAPWLHAPLQLITALLLSASLAGPGVAAGVAETAAAAALLQAAVPHRAKPAFPQMHLAERESRGQRALDLLGGQLPEVAAHYGKSADEFRARLLADRTWRLDQRGRVFIVEELDRPLPAPVTTPQPAGSTGLVDGTFAALDQTFLLHSKPGAQRTIYLNFKGATLTGTAWNKGGGSLAALPFDTDGMPYTFSSAELQRIQAIWQRVAEDYAPLDVNVTTEAVPLDRITRAGSTDAVFGTTVLITSNVGIYNCGCGGVAYLGVFDDTSDFYKPALVFYNQLGNGNEKFVAEAISHEAGHNLGLGHDGSSASGYYGGHGSGATGWAPIMGVGYYQSLVQWSKGEYSGATNKQDDFAVMQSNGLPLRNDDHGNALATATALTGASAAGLTTLAAQGIIERPTDIDVFSFAAGAGSASFSLNTAARSANLDARVTLRNAAGTVLASANPVDTLNANFSATLPAAGTYSLWVQGSGKGDVLATGYSNYGSLGQYALAATVPTALSQAPVAVITASSLRGTAPFSVAYSGAASNDADGSVQAWAWTFSDGGSANGASTGRTYTTPGSYSTVLKVTDNSGLSASSSVTVTVDPVVAVPTMRVSDIAMGLATVRVGTMQATVWVKVVDANGAPVASATVIGAWSGVVASGNGSARTNASGLTGFRSPLSNAASGTFIFTVTDVVRIGSTYAPLTNTETSDSISH